MMKLLHVNDLEHPEVAIYKHLRANATDEHNSFIADSPKVVNLLLESELEIKSMLATPQYYAQHEALIQKRTIPKLFVASKKLMESIVGHTIHHNVMMHGIRPKESPLEELGDRIIMLDEISSTENIGAIARSAAALGVNSYVVPKNGPHPYGRRALRVSMGYASYLRVHVYENIFTTLQRLRELGYAIYGAEVTEDALALSTLSVPKKWVLLMGHEGHGLSKDVINACDHTVQIEMAPTIKSFNVGIAASILMYQFTCKDKG